MFDNLILLTDSYKVTHWKQYPKGTTGIASYFESRGGKYPLTVFFGLQYFLKMYLTRRISMKDIEEAEAAFKMHFGTDTLFNRAGWERIVKVHGGKLPVSIKAVPEGTVVPNGNVLMTIENTDPELPWLTNYLETLLVQMWYPITVATQSWTIRRIINQYLEETGDPSGAGFKLHDFGFRGVSSVESAGIGGAAHLVNFYGTDTMAALIIASNIYHEPMAGFSIPAAEHSTITSWGSASEGEAFRNMIQQFGMGGSGLYAVVSDSYDIDRACTELWGGMLKAEVLDAPNTLVVRPDSGVPHEIVLRVLTHLGNAFGYSVNAKGYKVLNNKVRVIQGDGVNQDEIVRILSDMKDAGWSTDNIAFGMGGALLQQLNRDTNRFAFKAWAIEKDHNGDWLPVYKSPATDATKNSKAGKHRLIRTEAGVFQTVPANQWRAEPDILEEVFRDGFILKDTTFAEIRKRAEAAR